MRKYEIISSSSSSMAVQSSADLYLLNGLLPVISINLTVLRRHLRFPNCWLFPRWGRQPHTQPPTWRTRSPYLYPLETGWPSYTPRHWGTHFSCLLRNEWAPVGLFISPVTTVIHGMWDRLKIWLLERDVEITGRYVFVVQCVSTQL
jgi:hypothetical protein